jgi:large subunit ribosomal protein L4
MKTNIYSQTGKSVGTLELPETTFGAAWNDQFMHDIVVAYQANARAGTAHTKDRGEVTGTGKKPWNQKGTGRARHGDRKSPIWKGGGVAHGPKSEKDYTQKINRNARSKALAIALSKKYADGEIVFVDALTFAEPKTKDARGIINALGGIEGMSALATRRVHAATIVLPNRDANAEKSFANFGNFTVAQAKDVSVVDLLTNKFVVIAGAEAALETLVKRASTKQVRKAAAQ